MAFGTSTTLLPRPHEAPPSLVALNAVRNFRLIEMARTGEHPISGMSTTEIDDAWNELTSTNDPWGSRYEIVERADECVFGSRSSVHVYSRGEDGVSHSNGEDADDISSWSPKMNQFYQRRQSIRILISWAVYSLILAIPLYAVSVRAANRFFGRTKCDEPTTSTSQHMEQTTYLPHNRRAIGSSYFIQQTPEDEKKGRGREKGKGGFVAFHNRWIVLQREDGRRGSKRGSGTFWAIRQ
ncbi:hypothetical protein Pla52n_18130 [Stieleria varia]|uniref:Uncharacterized protein n=1 Tax=Stieleria varia TaxID=2528005 RepID=A0A5C6B1T4_9BACT|nr:hypothetical protein Pla52n_18130 [Stieleria varia]